MAKQFRFDQAFGNGRAVYGDERFAGSRAEQVQSPCRQFFTGTGFALDKHCGLGGGDFANQGEHLLHGLTLAKHDLGWVRVGPARAGGITRTGCFIGSRRLACQNILYSREHFVMVEGFGNVIHGAHLHGVDCGPQTGITGHDQYRRVGGAVDHFRTGGARQAQIGDDQVEAVRVEALGFFHRDSICHLIAGVLEKFANRRADNVFVFNNQNTGHRVFTTFRSGCCNRCRYQARRQAGGVSRRCPGRFPDWPGFPPECCHSALQ